jgi:hypothetical protein
MANEQYLIHSALWMQLFLTNVFGLLLQSLKNKSLKYCKSKDSANNFSEDFEGQSTYLQIEWCLNKVSPVQNPFTTAS